MAQDRIEVVKDPNYYDAGKVFLDKVVYRIIADATTRFNNLRSGDVEVLDAVAATDVDALKSTANLQLLTSESSDTRASRSTWATSPAWASPRGGSPVPWPGRWPRTPGSAGRSS